MLFAEKLSTLSTENFIYTLFETVKIHEGKTGFYFSEIALVEFSKTPNQSLFITIKLFHMTF